MLSRNSSRAVAQAVSRWLPTTAVRFASGHHVGFVVDKAAHWGRFSPSTSVSPANHSTNFFLIIITRGWNNRSIGGRRQSGPSWTPPQLYKLKNNYSYTMGTGRSFSGVKRPGREADHSPPTSAEVKKMWVYTSTPHTPSWRSA
jgi:hypothetical protein